VNTHGWVPIRWPCGPLEVERGTRREGYGPDDRDALEQWQHPRTLERLAGTPFNCLVVTWADGSPSDESQQRSLAPLVSAARTAGLALVGEVAKGADLRPAASTAAAAGLQALCTETSQSTESVEGFPVLRFGRPSVADRSPRGFLGVSGLPWPGLKVDLDEDTDASTGPTGPPWIDSNAWFVRLANELVRPETTWLSFEPPEAGPRDPGAAYVLAIADAEVYGARWLVSLDASSRRDLARGRGPGQETWSRIVEAVEFFGAHRAWVGMRPVGLLGVLSDFSGPNEWLSFEVLNLLSRHSRLYRVIPRQRQASAAGDVPVLDGLKALLYVDETPPDDDIRRRLYAFAEEGGTLITPPGWEVHGEPLPSSSFGRFEVSRYGQGRVAVAREELVDPYRLAEDAQALMSHRHDLVRVFNQGTGRFNYSRSEDGRSAVLHLFPYSRSSLETHVSVWFREAWQTANTWQPGTREPEPAERRLTASGVEFLIPPEPEVRRARSTGSGEQVRPAAAYRAVQLSS
jgi:hypothetical protein